MLTQGSSPGGPVVWNVWTVSCFQCNGANAFGCKFKRSLAHHFSTHLLAINPANTGWLKYYRFFRQRPVINKRNGPRTTRGEYNNS